MPPANEMPETESPEMREARSERRRTPPTSLPFTLRDMDEHIDRKLKQHLKPLEDSIGELKDMIQSGFPNGDPDEHRKSHEREEAAQRLTEKRWEIVKTKLLENSMWALMVAAVLAAWYWIKGNMK